MNEIIIDCKELTSPAALHRAFADALSFPEWYGRNLDALHDLLTSIRRDTTLVLQDFDKDDPDYAGFLLVLEDSRQENRHLTVLFP